MTAARDIYSLADAIARARPEMTERGQRVSLALYGLLGKGQPVTSSELAAATNLPESEIETSLEKWPGVYRDDQQGRVVGFWGLSVPEMPPHEISLDGRTLWAWCAWDTLFLPRRLGATLDVQSRCPTTGRDITLRVSSEDVAVQPAEVVVSFLEPRRPFDSDVIGSFCHHVHFFADVQAGEKWTKRAPRNLPDLARRSLRPWKIDRPNDRRELIDRLPAL